MGGALCMVEVTNSYESLVGRTERKRPRRRWEVAVKMDLG